MFPRALHLALLLLVACSRPEQDLVPVTDLRALFPYTAAGAERERIDLGRAEDAALLRDGWGDTRVLDDGSSVVVVSEPRTTIHLVLGQPVARELRIRAGLLDPDATLPAVRRSAPVLVSLNRRRIGTLRLGAALSEHRLTLPADAQHAGDNVLVLEHPTLPPTRGPHRGAPFPVIAYDWIDSSTPEGATAKHPYVDRDAIVLPAGARLDAFLRLPSGAELRFGLARERDGPPSDAGALVEVSVTPEGAAASTVYSGSPTAAGVTPVRVALAASAPGSITRLTFAAAGANTGAGIRLSEPAIVAPRTGVAPTAAQAAQPSLAAGGTNASGARPPNVLLYVIDTLRADHLGCYGYPRPTSPRLDALAADAVLFERVVAQASWTRPAVGSLLTGLEPPEHGATSIRHGIRDDVPTMAEIARERGLVTAAFVTNVNVSAPLGFARGFDSFAYLPEDEARPSRHVLSDELHRVALDWLDRRTDERPFLLYLHASDPHAPYTPRADFAARFPAADPADRATSERAAYDAEIAFNDAQLGVLLDALHARGLYDDTLIIVTSDHGEEFGEHGGFEHGHTLYDELLHVPLIVRLPRGQRAGERRTELARQIDVLPTLLAALGIEPRASLPGRTLLSGPDRADLASEARSYTSLRRSELSALVTARWKVVREIGGLGARPGVMAFDLIADPNEQHDVAGGRAELVGYARQVLQAAVAAPTARRGTGAGTGRRPIVDAATERRLRALGYVD